MNGVHLQLRTTFPRLAADIVIKRGEANAEIQAMCDKDWSEHRAVLFMDPYGMQVEWSTIEAIARTKAIDLWLLFPLGVAVNRLLTRSGQIPPSWRRRLDIMLGTTDWPEELYAVTKERTLFDHEVTKVVKASTDTIGRYFNERLATVFAGVATKPKVLLNSSNCPLYLLCFAVGSPSGTRVALNIANHLLRGVE